MSDSESKDINPEKSRADYVVSAAKVVLSQVPFVGSLLVEIAGNVIPDQRIDRLTKYAMALEKRLTKVEYSIVEKHKSDEYFLDLLEESMKQAAQSLSDERRDYIASLVANGISSEDIEYAESKHLLRILGELNDVEIIWLRFYLCPTLDGDGKFREKHQKTLASIPVHLGSSQSEIDKNSLQNSYKNHLASLGLLEKKSELKSRGYSITSLGKFLLREIVFSDER